MNTRQALLASPTFDTLAGRAGVARLSLRAGRVIVGVAVGLTALGLVMLYSATSAKSMAPGLDGNANGALTGQLRWVFLGLVGGWGASLVPLSWLRRAVVPCFLVALVLLGVLLVFGREINGARRWVEFGPVTVQPSEFLKLVVVLYLAHRLALREEGGPFARDSGLVAILAPVALGACLVLLEPDLGTSLFIVSEAVVLLALAGIRPTRVLPFALTALPLLALYAYTRFSHVRERLAGPNPQVQEALIAIGSGGVAGVGLGQGAQKLGSVPEMETDFIFSLVGEEFGFLGCAAVLLAFMAFAWYGRRLAWNARLLGPFPYYLAAGAVFVIVFQALINIAVVTSVVPTKGISLPFISKGGSNFLMVSIAVGLLWNVARRTAAEAGEDPLTSS